MNGHSRLCFAAVTFSLAVFGPVTLAVAQNQEKTTTVLDRQRPELDPLGVRLGAFMLFPTLSVGATHDDNIFRQKTGQVDDIITIVNPSLRLTSNWSRHQFGLSADAKIGRYVEEGKEDYEDYGVSANGRVDITRRANVTAAASFNKEHEDRGSPDDANGLNPTEYTIKRGNVAFNQTFNRVGVVIGGSFAQYDYDDVRTSSGSITNNDDRDRDVTEAFVRLGYEITPSYEAFVKATYNDRSYDERTDDNGLRRDSDGYEINAGVRLDLGGITFGDLFVGYQSQDYEDASLPTIDGISFGAGLTWNVTQLTTAKLTISRTIGETTQNNVSGTRDSLFRADVDHELLRNMLVGASASFLNSDFQGSSREDDTVTASVYAKYMMSRYLYIRASYDYGSRDSTASGSDYDNNRFMLRLEGQL